MSTSTTSSCDPPPCAPVPGPFHRATSLQVALVASAPLPARITRFLPKGGLADAMPRPRAPRQCKLLLLFNEMIRAARPHFAAALRELGFYGVVIDVIVLPHHCNALQMRAAALIEDALGVTGEAAAETHGALLEDAQLARRLLDAQEGTDVAGPNRPSSYPFIMALVSALVEAQGSQPAVRDALATTRGWAEFTGTNGPLAAWQQLQTRPLGGRMPMGADADDDSDEAPDYDAADVQRAIAAQEAAAGTPGLADGDDADRSGAEYLQHIAEYLSQRTFVNDVSPDLMDELDDETPSAGGASQWSADFDTPDVDDAEKCDDADEKPAAHVPAAPPPPPPSGPPPPFGAGALFQFDESEFDATERPGACFAEISPREACAN